MGAPTTGMGYCAAMDPWAGTNLCLSYYKAGSFVANVNPSNCSISAASDHTIGITASGRSTVTLQPSQFLAFSSKVEVIGSVANTVGPNIAV